MVHLLNKTLNLIEMFIHKYLTGLNDLLRIHIKKKKEKKPLGKYPTSKIKTTVQQTLDVRYSKVGHGSNLDVWLGASQIQS